jgi:hypothetical protein
MPTNPWCADAGALARAAAVWGDEYASHVAAIGALVCNQTLVVGSRCDAQQLIHGVLAARAHHTAIRSAGIRHSIASFGAVGNPAGGCSRDGGLRRPLSCSSFRVGGKRI